LNNREGQRDEARKNWKTIETIKELKEGYLSQVIHKITQLMVEYNAIVVLEELNFGFMRGRQRVEKQVYQKFEKMLIDKLNYLVDKNKPANKQGGVLKALQLTNKFESFQKLGKQSGFLFYIPAWNTSKICPVTGFVNLFDIPRNESVKKAKVFFSNFDAIRFNPEKNYFEFIVKDYSKFSGKAEGTRLNWTICTNGTRIKNFRNSNKNNEWDNYKIDLTSEIKNLFSKYGICLDSDLKAAIQQQSDKCFFYNDGKDKANGQKGLLQLFRFTVQMRNSETGTPVDYLISPVADENGHFYNSDAEASKGKDKDGKWMSNLPVDADANGAYNIARKGLWVIKQIKKAENLKDVNLAISNKAWLQFAQNYDQ
jgi:CRISPR-associated protein Cpf1